MELCENYLKHVFEIVRPGASLFEVVHKSESLEPPSKWENSPFNEYDKISVSKLYVQLFVAVCRYLRSTRKLCDMKTVISSLRNLHQISIEQYQISLESIECIFQATLEENSGQRTDEGLHIVSRKCTKKKEKKGKTATRPNVKKIQVASFAFIENSLKIHALESDLALSEGDYTALLSSVQEGLKLVDWAHESARCPLLLNFMSTALLYYLRGVAHVLSSKAGFDSWRVAGCVPLTGDQRRDIEEVSEIMSGLEISPIVVDNDSVRTSRRERKTSGDVNGNHTSLVRKLKEPALEDFDCNDDEHEEVEVETRKSQRNRSKLTKDPASEKTSKKTSARSRKMLSKKDKVANEVVESSSNPMESHVAGSGNTLRDDMHAKKDLKDVKKGSRCTKADIFNNDEVMAEGLTKTRRKVRGRKNSSSKNNDEGCRNSKSRTDMIAKDALHKRKRPVGSRSSKSITPDYKINQSVADGPCRKCDLSSQAFRGQGKRFPTIL